MEKTAFSAAHQVVPGAEIEQRPLLTWCKYNWKSALPDDYKQQSRT